MGRRCGSRYGVLAEIPRLEGALGSVRIARPEFDDDLAKSCWPPMERCTVSQMVLCPPQAVRDIPEPNSVGTDRGGSARHPILCDATISQFSVQAGAL
jgi:hypothetical protein